MEENNLFKKDDENDLLLRNDKFPDKHRSLYQDNLLLTIDGSIVKSYITTMVDVMLEAYRRYNPIEVGQLIASIAHDRSAKEIVLWQRELENRKTK